MKRILLAFPLIVTLLAACAASPANTPAPVKVESTPIPSNTEVILSPTDVPTDAPGDELPSMKLPAPSFESQTYLDQKFGFALDYPVGWTVSEPMFSERAKQVQFLSSPDLANAATVPEGATRISATVYEWDPKNDLAAAVAQWKTTWQSSGFIVLDEEELVLEQGLPATQFTVQTPDATIVHLITTLGDRYLMLSGEGDLELVKEIVQRVRPISVK